MNIRGLLGFVAISLVITAALFQDAVLGRSILAPVDLAPTFFSQYAFVDPDSNGIPENHYILDQLTYDLPLQWTIYHSYRQFEIPWWDPYTYAGRPLLADAHVNGTDPIRVLWYLISPDFVIAYNLTALSKSILCGLGMFSLLSFIRIPWLTSVGVGLAYQFSGAFAFFFGHPWIQGSFVYYPFLWIVLICLGRRLALNPSHSSRIRNVLANWELPTGGFLIACIFYAGNLQSHTYIVLFLLAWFLGEWSARTVFPTFVGIGVALMSFLGTLIAAPVLLNQVEFYLLSVRPVGGAIPLVDCLLRGILPLSAFFPWICGSFRTLDIGKIVELPGAGFQIYIGSALLILAVCALFSKTIRQEQRQLWATCFFVVAGFFVICFTPLITIFYTRMAPLPTLATCVLAAMAITWIPVAPRRCTGLAISLLGILLFAAANIGAHVLYPRFEDRIKEFVEKKASSGSPMPAAPALRQAQLDRFSAEVGWQNPETVFAAASIVALGCFLAWPPRCHRQGYLAALLALNLVPLTLFASRYIPSQSRDLFERLVSGGPAQQRLIAESSGGKRIFEAAAGTGDAIFPNAMAHFYKVHVVHGYSALQPVSLFRWPQKLNPPPRELMADIFDGESAPKAENTAGTVRFAREKDNRPAASISYESLNQVHLEKVFARSIIRTDTWFPGWTIDHSTPGVQLTPVPPSFARMTVPNADGHGHLTLVYVPRFLPVGIACALIGVLLAGIALLVWLRTDVPKLETPYRQD